MILRFESMESDRYRPGRMVEAWTTHLKTCRKLSVDFLDGDRVPLPITKEVAEVSALAMFGANGDIYSPIDGEGGAGIQARGKGNDGPKPFLFVWVSCDVVLPEVGPIVI